MSSALPGAWAVVFRARRPAAPPRDRARFKTIRPGAGRALNPENQTRFFREARATAAIQHDHIVPIYQVSEERGVPFFAMPLLRGNSLEERLAKEPRLLLAETLRIGREVAEGLAEAHERGLVHRDIKPANIWLEGPGGRVKLLDFGLVSSTSDGAGLTRSGVIVGTPAYMSPEQTSGSPVDHRSDLFSLGCLLYRLATGKPPFSGSDAISTLVAVISSHPSPPLELDPAIPTEFSHLIMELLEKDPANRPHSARAVADELAAIARESPSAPVSASRPATAHRALVPAPTLTQARPAPAPKPAPAIAWSETRTRPQTSGCTKAFAGCGVLSIVVIILSVLGLFMLFTKGVPTLVNAINDSTKRQNAWAEVGRVWKAPPDAADSERLFPKAVAGVPLHQNDTEADLPEIGFDIPGKHAVYGERATAVEIFVYRATALEKSGLYQRLISPANAGGPSLYRYTNGTSQDQRITYELSPPEQKGVLWWAKGWLFLSRSTSGADADKFLREFLTEQSRSEASK